MARSFHNLVDTGGLELVEKNNKIHKLIRLQVEVAVEEADLLLFVVDGREGLNPLDEYVADFLRRFQKDTLLIANKVDDYTKQEQIMEF